MPDFCTCGAQLPPDSLFCHKCGKPQREIAVEEFHPAEPEVAPPPAPPPATVPVPLKVDFHNPIAVRIGLMMAAISTLLIWIPFLNFMVAGFGSAYFYRRRMGVTLNVRGGVRMGWITGVMMFAISIIMFSAKTLADGGLDAQIRQQFRNLPSAGDPAAQQVLAFLQSPSGMAVTMAFVLVFMFLCITGLSMAGGALGARLAGGGNQQSRL